MGKVSSPASAQPAQPTQPAQAAQGPAYSSALVAGALSGLTVDLLFYPIDTIKTRLQSSQGFVKSGGFNGVYRGLGSVAVGSAPGAAAFFVTYESLKPSLTRWAPEAFGPEAKLGTPASHMVAASVAEVAACLIRVPTEVVKSRQQTSSYGSKTSSLEGFKSVWREGGARGFYKGFAGTVGREIPFTCLQFPLYEHLKLLMSRSEFFGNDPNRSASLSSHDGSSTKYLPTWQAGLAGSIAGAVAAGLTTPLDVVKTRIMLERRSASASTPSSTPSAAPTLPAGVNTRILPTLSHIFRTEGLRALFSGFVPRTLWIGFGGAVFLGTFDGAVKVLEGTEG